MNNPEKSKVRILLAGIGGYGEIYVHELLPQIASDRFEIVGIADPNPENCAEIGDFRRLGVKEYMTAEEFFAHGGKADLTIISSPIQFHRGNVCAALENGSNVLCEKPVAATLDDVRKMIAARDASGKFAAIGYQWSYTDSVQSMKADILSGAFGKPVRMKTMVLWPRGKAYFNRSWAARIRDSEGRMVLDSVANNATAHYLHNMLYLLGSDRYSSTKPKTVRAELYRANRIENFDTAAIRIVTENDVEMLFLVTHAVKDQQDPTSTYEFEKATVTYDSQDGFRAVFNDGTVKEYGWPEREPLHKLWLSIDAVSSGAVTLCGLEAGASHTMCIAAAHLSVPVVADFPAELIRLSEEGDVTWTEGLGEIFKNCYRDFKMPFEINTPWAKPGVIIDIAKEGLRL